MSPVLSTLRNFSACRWSYFVGLLIGLAACSQAPPAIQPTSTNRSELLWYNSPTPTLPPPTLKPNKTDKPTPLPPTPTPLTYTVVKGDTILGIALRYGIKLEDLLAANPEVDPRFLSVDTDLIIPLGDVSPPALATPTPIPASLSEPDCYPTLDSGAWCFVQVKNHLEVSLENVSVRVYLDLGNLTSVLEKTAFTPLNLIPPGQVMPVAVFFDPPVEQLFSSGAELISALPAVQENERYIPARLKLNQVDIEQTGRSAVLAGNISIPKRSKPAGLIQLLAVAYGRDDRVVGIRQIGFEGPIEAGVDLPYSVEVFSLGPPIERVEAFIEASPESGDGTSTPTGN